MIRFAWLFPVLVIRWNGDWARQFWLVVLLPRGASKALLRHELVHVKQDILTCGLAPFLALLWPGFRFRREAAAYAESVRHGGNLGRYASILSKHYGIGKSERECRVAIRKYLESGRIL